MDKKQCKHTLVHNEDEDFIFCSKCGKRWGENKCEKKIIIKKEYVERYPWYPPYTITCSSDNTNKLIDC